MTDETPASIHAFWFGEMADDGTVASRQAKLWWGKDDQVDAGMRQRFARWVAMAGHGGLDAWADTPPGLLSLVLLTDQFPRNIHRGRPEAFATDAVARLWVHRALEHDMQRLLRPIERLFLYLPLEHSESLADQDLAVAHLEALARQQADQGSQAFDGYADYARRHREVIARFGRFPHRNAILGRISSAEELAFLQQPGSSF
jgi:uncharacterized protein (DUF924 family)